MERLVVSVRIWLGKVVVEDGMYKRSTRRECGDFEEGEEGRKWRRRSNGC
jgi:hypothetical protein